MGTTPMDNAQQLAYNAGYRGEFGGGQAAAWLAQNPTIQAQVQNVINSQPAGWAGQPIASTPAPTTTAATTSAPTPAPTTATTTSTTTSNTSGLSSEQIRATNLGRSMGLLSATETATNGLLASRLAAAGADTKARYDQLWTSGASTANQSLPDYYQDSIQNPTLPNGAQFVPTLSEIQSGELLNTSNYLLGQSPQAQSNTVGAYTPVQAAQMGAANPLTSAQAQGTQTNVTDATGGLSATAQQYDPTLVSGLTPQAQAQQMEVQRLATMQGQLEELYADLEGGAVPAWARGAVNAANAAMAARGIANSSIGVTAVMQAVQNSAFNIAATDAATYFQADLANLNNRQQTELTNVQLKQQSLLSDQAASNAAKQFNASSMAQLQQFQAGLIAQINEQNAVRMTAVSQFNAAQTNQMTALNEANRMQTEMFNAGQTNELAALNANIQNQRDMFNAQIKDSVEKFNVNLSSQREQFNSQMRAQIDQSNAVWRRAINTQNTATINAAAAGNVQNLFNMSQVAQNNLWQAWRDEASWLFTAQEGQKDRDLQMLMAANNQQYMSNISTQAQEYAMWQQVGNFISGFFN